MIARMPLFAAALLASATLQARTPELPAVNDPAAPARVMELPAPPEKPVLEEVQLPPTAEPLVLDQLPGRQPAVQEVVDNRPRQTISLSAGMELSTLNYGVFGSLGYAYRVKGNFWIGGMWQGMIGFPFLYSDKLLEQNYWELPLCSWLAVRFGVGLGVWLYNSDGRTCCWGIGRLMMQWVVQLGRTVSLTCSPFIVGPSYLDFMFGKDDWQRFAMGGEYVQLGLSFRF